MRLILAGLISLALASAPAHAQRSQSELLRVIKSTRVIGAHLGWAYNMTSMRKLQQRIKTEDLPVLLQMYAQGVEQTGVRLAISTQCQAGVDAVARATRSVPPELDHYRARELFEELAGNTQCPAAARASAQQAYDRL